MSVSISIGTPACHLLQEYDGTDVWITGFSSDCVTGIENIIVFDTSDGKHWLQDVSSESAALECGESLLNSKIYWSINSGFSYQPGIWKESAGTWRYGHKRPVPLTK